MKEFQNFKKGIKTKVSYLLITHDMNVVRQMSDDVLVLSHGSLMEYGKSNKILNKPQNEYTKKLVDSSFLS